MSDIYTSEFLYYFKNQPFKKDLKSFTHKGNASNSHCGDDIGIKLLVKERKIDDIGYKSDGCSISQGAMSILSEYAKGKSVDELLKLSDEEFVKLMPIELTPARQKCALNSLYSLRNALKNEKK